MKKYSWLLVPILLAVASTVVAQPPKTIALLEETHVEPGSYAVYGAMYVVPEGRTATVSAFFCEIRSNNPTGTGQITLVVLANTTVTGATTHTLGMNPIDCVNTPAYFTQQTSGAMIRLLPGNWLQVFFTNVGQQEIFVMLSAFIYEEDLPNH